MLDSDVPAILGYDVLISLIQWRNISLWTLCFYFDIHMNTYFFVHIYEYHFKSHCVFDLWQNMFSCKYDPVCRSGASVEFSELTVYMFCIFTSVGWKTPKADSLLKVRIFCTLTLTDRLLLLAHLWQTFFSSFHSFINDHPTLFDPLRTQQELSPLKHLFLHLNVCFPILTTTAHVAHIIRRHV